jgi:hypothetical protein
LHWIIFENKQNIRFEYKMSLLDRGGVASAGILRALGQSDPDAPVL